MKIEFFPQETYDIHILGTQALVFAGYEDIKIGILQFKISQRQRKLWISEVQICEKVNSRRPNFFSK